MNRVVSLIRENNTAPEPPRADGSAYQAVRAITDSLASPLGAEDQVVQSMPDASPTKWHRAHTTWFFEEFVLSRLDGYQAFDDDFRYLFNSYYEAVGPRQPRPRRGMITRPDVAEVGRYRAAVDDAMTSALDNGALDPFALDLVQLGLQHEQQHQELLLMDAKHMLSQNPLDPAYEPRTAAPAGNVPTHTPPAGRLEHDGGLIEVGCADSEDGFHFDNERPVHRQWLEPFALEDRLVTNGEWIEFMEDGGYDRVELWLSDGWHLRSDREWTAPLYWSHAHQQWHQFTLYGNEPVDLAAPVTHVSYHEADAFARWRGARLPTESEWEAVARAHWQPPRRGACPALNPSRVGSPGTDPFQFCGEVWQWTTSAYLPYPGFKPATGAVGEYNGKFMVDQHVLRGSASVTPPGHERVSYRNFFPTRSRWAFSGLRLAHDN